MNVPAVSISGQRALLLPLALIVALPAFAKGLSSEEQNKKNLEILISNASSIKMEGDVHDTETLSAILASALAPRKKDMKADVKNSCVTISRDGIDECTLDIQFTHSSGFKAETVISYETLLNKDKTPDKMLIQRVYVSRGH